MCIHHVVPGLIVLLLGGVLAWVPAEGLWRQVAGLMFGVGAALVLDEFAMVLHLDDVYWSSEGRLSADAVTLAAVVMFCALLIIAPNKPPPDEVTSFWLSVTSSILFILFWLLPISVTILKGKLWMAALAMLVAPVGWFAAIRVAARLPMGALPVPAVAGQTAEGATPRRQVGPSTAADQELDFRAPVRSTCGHHRASVNYGYVCAGHHIPAIVATAYTFSVRSTSTSP